MKKQQVTVMDGCPVYDDSSGNYPSVTLFKLLFLRNKIMYAK